MTSFVRNLFKSMFTANTGHNRSQTEMRSNSRTHEDTDTTWQTDLDTIPVTDIDCYYRTLSTQNVMHLWRIIEHMNELYEFHSRTHFVHKLTEIMSEEFDKRSALDCFEMVDNAVEHRMIVSQTDQTNRFRFVANRDTTAFTSFNLTHDWYCFECHSNDQTIITVKLIPCKRCWRSFHVQCVKTRIDCDHLDDFRCGYCCRQSQQTRCDEAIGDINQLNKLLKYIMINCDYFLNDSMYDTLSFDQLSDLFVFHSMDLRQIESKISVNGYQTLNEFENDVKQFEHNFSVSPNFTDQSLAKRFRKFHKLFHHELSELKICVNCYDYSNELQYNTSNSSSDWFCRICSPPHELVYARVNGYSYWPSKLLRVTANNQYDVRFFDPPNFTRALVSEDRIQPITHQFTAEDIKKWKLEQPIRLMMAYMKNLDDKGFVIEQTITNGNAIKYKDFVQLITPLLKSSKRKSKCESGSSDDVNVVKKVTKINRKK